MSTGWNAVCLDHPDSRRWLDDDWSGSGDGPARTLAELWRERPRVLCIADLALYKDCMDPLQLSLEYDYRHVTLGMIQWMREHKDCRVELVSEYRDRLAIDSLRPQRPRHCRTCSCEPRVWT